MTTRSSTCRAARGALIGLLAASVLAAGPAARDELHLVAGDPAPDFEVETADGTVWTLEAVAGRPVLLVVIDVDTESCAEAVPELDRIVERYGPDGLLVLGMSPDPVAAQAAWVEEHGARMTVGRTADRILERRFAGAGVPRAFLIDGAGGVAWAGHPARFRSEAGSKMYGLTQDVFIPPTLPAEHKQIARQLARGEYGDAWAALAQVVKRAPRDTAAAAAREALEAGAASLVAAAEKTAKRGRPGDAHARLQHLAEAWEGVPGTEGVAAALTALEQDEALEDELTAAARVRKALVRWREGQFASALDALHDVGQRYGDTPTGAWAAEVALRHR